MFIKSLKNSISSLKLAKKASLAIFKDSSFSSLISEHFSSELPKNIFIASNIYQPPKSVYLNILKDMLANSNYKPQQIQSVALKFQKILSLEIEQYTIERLLSNQTATHSSDFWGAYDIFPEDLTCEQCHTEFSINYDEQKISVNITNTPTICTLWSQNRLVKNFAQIGNLVDNPFQYTSNSKGYFIFPINLTTIYNGNHSTNVALYENNTVLDNIAFMDISSWMDKIYFNHKTNTFDHLSCNAKTTNQQLFHENIGYIYEIGQFLYLNGLSISTENFS